MEIIVDAYGPEEQALGWYYYLDDKLQDSLGSAFAGSTRSATSSTRRHGGCWRRAALRARGCCAATASSRTWRRESPPTCSVTRECSDRPTRGSSMGRGDGTEQRHDRGLEASHDAASSRAQREDREGQERGAELQGDALGHEVEDPPAEHDRGERDRGDHLDATDRRAGDEHHRPPNGSTLLGHVPPIRGIRRNPGEPTRNEFRPLARSGWLGGRGRTPRRSASGALVARDARGSRRSP